MMPGYFADQPHAAPPGPAEPYLCDHPDLGLPFLLDRYHREVLPDGLPPVPFLAQNLSLRSRCADPPREARAPIVPLAERDFAARVEGYNIQDIHRLPLLLGVGANAIRNALHLLQQVGSELSDGDAELLRDCTNVRPVKLACLLEELAVDG